MTDDPATPTAPPTPAPPPQPPSQPPLAPAGEASLTDPAEAAKPAEGTLYDDPATADLGAKVSEAWTEFVKALAAALPDLPARCTLDLTLDPNASGVGEAMYSVSVERTEVGDLLAYAVSNALLPAEYRLSRTAVAELVALGWSPPGVVAKGDERFAVSLPTSQSRRLAAILSRTMRDVYGTPHPAFLMYTMDTPPAAPATPDATTPEDSAPPEDSATSEDSAPLEVSAPSEVSATPEESATPEDSAPSEVSPSSEDSAKAGPSAPSMPQLGAARAVAGGGEELGVPGKAVLDAMPLPEKVASVIAAMLNTAPENLPVDNDGDIGIRSGSAMVFVRVRDNPPLVDVFSPVLSEVDANQQLYVKLAELTHRMPIGRLYCENNTVWASVPVFGRDFQATHLMLAVQVMTGLADELDDRLHGEFGGKRFFVDGDRPDETPKDDKHTGMYL